MSRTQITAEPGMPQIIITRDIAILHSAAVALTVPLCAVLALIPRACLARSRRFAPAGRHGPRAQ